ncbi:SET domain-containing protein [Trametopsis cervina]|nr:SET domain-containing protein [Trametopsis cervina]
MRPGAFTNTLDYVPHVVKFEVNIEEQEETFHIQDVPNKGKGLVAARPIRRGEFLFSETPLFTLPPSPTNSMVLGALAKCTREQQCEYFTLANSYRKKLLPALAIFETNFLLLGRGLLKADPQAAESAGIFLQASRFNSSCTPNVNKIWDDLHGVMVFRTLRDVVEGEELCFNYCDVLATREQRTRELSTEFGFDCICEACCLEGEAALDSDRRRSSIARLFDEIGQCWKEPTLGIRKIQLALCMLKEESLVHHEASFCYDAYQFCVSVSDFQNAKKWIRRAWEVSCITSGQDSNAARMFKIYYANPRSHQLAALLPKMTLSGPDGVFQAA